MRPPDLRVHLDGLIVDSFAGGGGASSGIESALGRSPDIAINHDPEAIAMHAANHPNTRHYVEDIFAVDPVEACAGRPVALAWFSPDCTHHSKAKGAKPRDNKRRGLADVVITWARKVRPRIIILENVEEFRKWGPLDENGIPIKSEEGFEFRRWRNDLIGLGYQVEERELRACDYGTPTIRKRLFVGARCDGRPFVWPEPTNGPTGLLGLSPYRTAAECIDFSIPCPSIFLSTAEGKALGVKRPLEDPTLRRLARGTVKHVIKAARPFIVPVTHPRDARIYDVDEPLRTVTAAPRGEMALVAPTLIQTSWGEREGQAPRCLDIEKPLGTVMAGGIKHAVAAALLIKQYGGHEGSGWPLDRPISTITTQDHHHLATAHLMKLYGTSETGADVRDPMPTVTAGGWHIAEVRAFLIKYYGASVGQAQSLFDPIHTIPTHDRYGLVVVMINGWPWVIADIGMRMLTPRELFLCQGFDPDYIIDPLATTMRKRTRRGRVTVMVPVTAPLSKTAQIRCAGNSVCPPLAAAIVRANFADRAAGTVAA